ncbi:polysaccharide biosynthesis/export family protein [Hyphobacterium sp. HN65]|uniref:Polysaccharide biosynthesis/export family protein n=1 Tax=Hyphobacterium lacteum TaxID=3116575 RepID=A0ABU7LNB8_9PROT|nr:polysaccharide biosynthesis/export family protein [Hyphobacterium sp. HN65]MEE2525106.1 polysaccharide biosynthesis/export family protein [Hyphobacterium sp. HN65]
MTRILLLLAAFFAALFLGGCGATRAVGNAVTSPFERAPRQPDYYSWETTRGSGSTAPAGWGDIEFVQWRNEDPAFRLFPGDTIDVTVHTASELNRTATVGPDGRVNLPLAGRVMVAGRTDAEAASAIADSYTTMLRNPIVEVTATEFGAQNIIVGGQVNSPGMYAMPSRIGALEAVILAGGFRDTAARGDVVVLRRSPSGDGLMMRTVNLHRALRGDGEADGFVLQRHDIVFVPRSTVAEVTLFIEQYVYGILPLDQAFSYAIANAINNN